MIYSVEGSIEIRTRMVLTPHTEKRSSKYKKNTCLLHESIKRANSNYDKRENHKIKLAYALCLDVYNGFFNEPKSCFKPQPFFCRAFIAERAACKRNNLNLAKKIISQNNRDYKLK